MMFRRTRHTTGKVFALALMIALPLVSAASASGDRGHAVVPTAIIYPGEVVNAGRLEEVKVTNPNLSGDYARSIGEVIGLISTRTLLPGRTISVSSLREPFAVTRGSNVRLTFTIGNLLISAAGSPLMDASIGDVIRVRNLDSGIIVSGTVMADGTVQVVAK
ncbi:flagellar basal body P-ring formation protein FlgA [Rhizobiaceae bacterium n13]|uniref:Flagella basal body P-ring formation protein FlgA n=1 Tax=Ferirhizobium litorale TaxID=2927786 RepID=A0AAE3QAR2_9HYPH|nr:flagellar basal body P-ring formation chaperone FlgA [Fererhizobium litorale]MDI7863401.1 flagellar basal body P-ring formation protein FlgA [Fererhizobium litorale]MDI7922322.1 flagellar basal body P-ring formation protein FlgA [Fererhizobium litorale]